MTTTVIVKACCNDDDVIIVDISNGFGHTIQKYTLQNGEEGQYTIYADLSLTVYETEKIREAA